MALTATLALPSDGMLSTGADAFASSIPPLNVVIRHVPAEENLLQHGITTGRAWSP